MSFLSGTRFTGLVVAPVALGGGHGGPSGPVTRALSDAFCGLWRRDGGMWSMWQAGHHYFRVSFPHFSPCVCWAAADRPRRSTRVEGTKPQPSLPSTGSSLFILFRSPYVCSPAHISNNPLECILLAVTFPFYRRGTEQFP